MHRPKLDPAGFFGRLPLKPHDLQARVTPTRDMIVLCHLGVPQLDASTWRFAIDGLVRRPLSLGMDDLRRYPKHELVSVHQCAGSPLDPLAPAQRVANVRWGGARLADILGDCVPEPQAKFVWSYGADHGVFAGVEAEAYLKDMPIARASGDPLVAYEVNGAHLPAENGFPARLVVPGFYGTNSVKWLTRMTLAATRARGPFTTRWYNDAVFDAGGADTGERVPVWAVAPQSVIVSPAPDATLQQSASHEIWGWAWADGGLRKVDVTTDGGRTFAAAALEPPSGRGWQRFSLPWRPTRPGGAVLSSIAEGLAGERQPPAGRRNAEYRVPVDVV